MREADPVTLLKRLEEHLDRAIEMNRRLAEQMGEPIPGLAGVRWHDEEAEGN